MTETVSVRWDALPADLRVPLAVAAAGYLVALALTWITIRDTR
jgi:hypothetical protein